MSRDDCLYRVMAMRRAVRKLSLGAEELIREHGSINDSVGCSLLDAEAALNVCLVELEDCARTLHRDRDREGI